MAFKPGKNPSVTWNAIQMNLYCDKASLDRLVDLLETTTMSSTNPVFVTRLPGVQDWKFTLSGKYDPALESTVGLETDAAAGTARALEVRWDGTTVVGATNPRYTATVLCRDIKMDTDVKGVLLWTANFSLASGTPARSIS